MDGEDNCEDDGDDQEGAKGLGQGRDHECAAVFFKLLPYKLRSKHQADGNLQYFIEDAVPAAVENRLRKDVEGMGTQNHSADEPAKNGRHMNLCHETSQQEGAGQGDQ